MPSDSLFDQFSVSVNGTELAAEIMNDLDEAVVEDDLAQPAMFTLRFHDPAFTLIDGTQFKLGAEVTISAVTPANQRKVILVGEVTALEPMLSQRITLLVVRGYDLSHRLYRGHQTRTFLKQTDSQIAQKIAQEAGLSADAESTSVSHDYVIQNNESDMDFLRARAARIGFRVRANGKKLVFGRAEQTPPAAPAQTWGQTLLEFRSRMTAVAQSNAVEVRGWDIKTKTALVGKATTAANPSAVLVETGGAAAKKAFSSAATVLVSQQPVATQAEATGMAQAVLNQLAGDYLSAEGACYGEPALKAGTLVELKGIGTRLSGKYFVTATRHSFSHRDGYRTSFSVNGHRAHNLLTALAGNGRERGVVGVVVGVVTNNKDPDGLGRVKVKFPWLNEQEESNWARLAAAGAGATRGLSIMPEVNDEVLVAFEHGDMSRPYVVGGLWNGKDKPPFAATAVKNGKVEQRGLMSRAGHQILVQDEDQGGLIQLKTKSGRMVEVSETDKNITIKSQNHTITLDDQGRAVKIQSAGDVEIAGAGGKLKITASGVEITSNTSMKLQANANLQLQANAQLQVQAQAMLDLKSSGILNIQGTLVKIN